MICLRSEKLLGNNNKNTKNGLVGWKSWVVGGGGVGFREWPFNDDVAALRHSCAMYRGSVRLLCLASLARIYPIFRARARSFAICIRRSPRHEGLRVRAFVRVCVCVLALSHSFGAFAGAGDFRTTSRITYNCSTTHTHTLSHAHTLTHSHTHNRTHANTCPPTDRVATTRRATLLSAMADDGEGGGGRGMSTRRRETRGTKAQTKCWTCSVSNRSYCICMSAYTYGYVVCVQIAVYIFPPETLQVVTRIHTHIRACAAPTATYTYMKLIKRRTHSR